MSKSNQPAVIRTAPIAIAPKPVRQNSYRQDSCSTSQSYRSMPGLESAEASYTGRAPSPCDICQRFRIKCTLTDDDEEGCLPCQNRGSECSFVSSPPARKRKLNGHLADDGKRSSPGRSDIRRRRQPQPSLSSTAGSSSFIEDMANVGGPTLLKRTLGLQNDRYSQYIGPTTDFEPSLINLSPFDPHDESLLSRGTLRKVSDDETFLMLPDMNTPGYEHTLEDIEEVEAVVRPHGKKLVDLYYRIVHPGFPIIQKTVFLEKYERGYREFSPPLLAAVYILAINWWDHDEELRRIPRPDVRELERLVRTTLSDAMYRPKLSTIQAGLLLSQRPEGDQWAPTAQLVAIGQELGLHLDCTGWKIPPWEKGLRKRLAWALYMQDKWGALVHGRPSHIFASNWGVRPLTEHDFPDVEWDENDSEDQLEIERGRTLFSQMVHLSQILSEILDTFYTLQAKQTVTNSGAQGTHLVLSLAKPIQLKFKEGMRDYPRLSAWTILSRPRSFNSAYPALAKAAYFGHGLCQPIDPSHIRSFWYFASKTNFALIGTFGSLLWATSPGREEADWYRRRLGEYRWTLSVSSKPGEGTGLTAFAMKMLDISTGLLKKLPEKPSMSRSGSVADIAGSVSSGPSGLSALSSLAGAPSLGSFSGLPSRDASMLTAPKAWKMWTRAVMKTCMMILHRRLA
ncbi:transcriptional activator protein DAL81 [Verticillium alfalfae VaMs.102]|uniref:Transcriptional activator protein DAL81 n=1 Tax=Verticillium alfalfae (strain VaMs.102 / ATCC MYA-4576 / FGSC 10136) TaxID=526221 RepID=C9STC6_VERA1|nr:transcriptional activator protein DAL81 [Verticillium alfalfae VaMs.102]EEY22041.1 transcriptional activator protein DAL81 [Verticillium alfalfae VaMs.102]